MQTVMSGVSLQAGRSRPHSRFTETRTVLAAVLLFTALTIVMTWPQAAHLRDAVRDDGDPLLVTWIFAWVAHQLPRAPAHLFDANIFYPEHRTLAMSETMLAPAIAVAPLHWIGVGSITIYNIVLLSGFALSGVATALLARRLTGSAAAGLVSGVIFAFLPYRVDQFSHAQLQQAEWIPLALWAAHSVVSSRRVRDGALLGAAVAGQALSCMYYGLFLAPYLAVVVGVLLLARGRVSRGHLAAFGVAAAVAAVVVWPVVPAYLGARRAVGERSFQDVLDGSATWQSYLAAPALNAIYGRTLSRFVLPERVLFPGIVPVALAAMAFWPRPRTAESARGFSGWFRVNSVPAAYLVALIVAFDLSFGLHGFLYRPLYEYLVPFRALRIPARMGVMVGFSLAVLAAFGVARLSERAGANRRWIAVAAAALVVVEYVSRPIPLQPIPEPIPGIYADLLHDVGDNPTSVIVEYPIGDRDDPTYMYYSTAHWQHLVNGFAGFFPKSYYDISTALETFPDDRSMAAIHARGIRYLLVHQERMIGTRYERAVAALDRRGDLRLVSRGLGERHGQHGEISLYRVLY